VLWVVVVVVDRFSCGFDADLLFLVVVDGLLCAQCSVRISDIIATV